MVGYDRYGHLFPKTQWVFLRNSYIWLRTKPTEGILSAFLLYSDRNRKICQERESRGLPSCSFGAKPYNFLDCIQPGQSLSKDTCSSPCQAGRVQQLWPVMPRWYGSACCCRTVGSSVRSENTRGLGKRSPQPAQLSQMVFQVWHHSPATGLVQVPVHIPPNKQDIQFVPFYTPLWHMRNIKEAERLVFYLFGDGRGEMFEIGCGYDFLGWFLFTLRNSSSALPSWRIWGELRKLTFASKEGNRSLMGMSKMYLAGSYVSNEPFGDIKTS